MFLLIKLSCTTNQRSDYNSTFYFENPYFLFFFKNMRTRELFYFQKYVVLRKSWVEMLIIYTKTIDEIPVFLNININCVFTENRRSFTGKLFNPFIF